MLNSSIIEILRTFDKSELKRFEDFLNSPYFNKNKVIVKLFNHLKKYFPKFNNDALRRESVWKYIYPGKDFNYGVMKNLLYEMNQVTERFLAEETLAKNKFTLGMNLLDNLCSKDLYKIFLSKYKLLDEKLVGSLHGINNFENLTNLKWMMYSTFDNMDSAIKFNIHEIGNLTIAGFLINIFKIYNNISAQNFMVKIEDTDNLTDKFLENTDLNAIFDFISKDSNLKKEYTVLNIYFYMYKSIKNTDTDIYFYNFKNNLIKNIQLFDSDEARNLFACLWTSLSYNKVIKNKLFEFNDLNKYSHKLDIMFDIDGTISMRNYSLGIRFAAMAKDIDFLLEFKEKYLNLLRPSVVSNMKLYSEAYLGFAKKDFKSALESISLIKFDLITFKYELKNLQIMIYYEINDIESVIYAIDSYKHYALNNKNVSESTKEIIFKFLNYVNVLCKLKANQDNIKMEMLKESILADSINTKYWLLEKIEEIQSGRG